MTVAVPKDTPFMCLANLFCPSAEKTVVTDDYTKGLTDLASLGCNVSTRDVIDSRLFLVVEHILVGLVQTVDTYTGLWGRLERTALELATMFHDSDDFVNDMDLLLQILRHGYQQPGLMVPNLNSLRDNLKRNLHSVGNTPLLVPAVQSVFFNYALVTCLQLLQDMTAASLFLDALHDVYFESGLPRALFELVADASAKLRLISENDRANHVFLRVASWQMMGCNCSICHAPVLPRNNVTNKIADLLLPLRFAALSKIDDHCLLCGLEQALSKPDVPISKDQTLLMMVDEANHQWDKQLPVSKSEATWFSTHLPLFTALVEQFK
jgi:hypothetical protein